MSLVFGISYVCRENKFRWNNFRFRCMINLKLLHMSSDFKFLKMTDVEKFEILHVCDVENASTYVKFMIILLKLVL